MNPPTPPSAVFPTALVDLFDRVTTGLALVQDGRFLYANGPLSDIFGYEPAELLALAGLQDLADAEDGTLIEDTLRRCLDGEEGHMPCIFRGRRKDGSVIDVELAGAVMSIDGRAAVLAHLRDVTQRRMLAARAIEAEARHRQYERLLDTAEVFIWEEDLSGVWAALQRLRGQNLGDIGRHLREHPALAEELMSLLRINHLNAASARLLGIDRDRPGASSLPDETRRMLAAIFREQLVAIWDGLHELRCDVVLPRAPDKPLTGLLTMRMPQTEAAARQTAVVLLDITERKAAESRLAHLARFDSLTSLPNRATFTERLTEAMARARRGGGGLAIHILDIDGFKAVNDTLGHPTGDSLLQAIGKRLKGTVRSTDTVARLGGDEFAIIQTDVTDASGVDLLASKLLRRLAQPYTIAERRLNVSVSIGITLLSPRIRDPEMMMAHADLALYRAKQEGRNRYRFHSLEMEREIRARTTLAGQLREAIETDQLLLYYQPQVAYPGGEVIGLEALLRWRRSDGELLRPASFLRIAEETGLIVPMGQWALRAACRQLHDWTQAGIEPPLLAVNVSARQLRSESDFEAVLRATLREHGLAPSQLELQLTEAVLADAARESEDPVEELRRLGVGIAIDDFGTGSSSLGYLTSFRFNRLKVAHQFVHDILSNSSDLAIVRASLRLAEEIGLRAIAEGVENRAQADLLASLGCHEMQGRFFGRPMPAAAVEPLLRAGRIQHPATAGALTI
ncbi:MAG TPA: EAL domain-containing protein [Dongiaceae bacterium]|nr:EAL domain-containing protein [Dongiaceae bacterium]